MSEEQKNWIKDLSKKLCEKYRSRPSSSSCSGCDGFQALDPRSQCLIQFHSLTNANKAGHLPYGHFLFPNEVSAWQGPTGSVHSIRETANKIFGSSLVLQAWGKILFFGKYGTASIDRDSKCQV